MKVMKLQLVVSLVFSLNSIYFHINIYTWQHTSIHKYMHKWIRKKLLKTYKFFSKSIFEM